MSAFGDEIGADVETIFKTQWSTRDGQKVPEAEDVQLGNHAVKINGTVLYADLSASTAMVNKYKASFAAEMYKAFLLTSAKIIRRNSGVITAYDGDRIMAVFFEGNKNTHAMKAALQINYAVLKIIRPAISRNYPKDTYLMKHVVGVDTSPLFVARTGIRGSNDLVWVGRAANYAAKMSDFHNSKSTYISRSVYDNSLETVRLGGDPKRNMWKKVSDSSHSLNVEVYSSTWHWEV